MRLLMVVVLFSLFYSPAHAQSADTDQWLVWMMDRFGEDLDEESLLERLNALEAYLVAPSHISNLDGPTLYALQLLTENEIRLILEWMTRADTEILSEVSFRTNVKVDEMVTELIVALTIFENEETERVERRWWGSRLGVLRGMADLKTGRTFPKQNGYRIGGQYLGPEFTLREQYVLQSEAISLRFSRYKMAGEPINYPKKLGPWTGSIVYQSNKSESSTAFKVRTFILGDHRFRSGHGLIASTGTMRVEGNKNRASSMSSAPVTPNGASPSGKFHRGLGIWATAGNNDIAISYSFRRLSASITDTLLYAPGWSTHIRTAHDLNKHHNVTLSSVSVMARRHGQIGPINVNLGASAVGYRWSDQVHRRPGFSYEGDATGLDGFEWSAFGSVVYREFTYTNEIGRANAKTGWIQGFQIHTAQLDLGLWSRKYPFGFETRFGNSASAYGGTNELGFGAWVRVKPVQLVNLMAWTDSYSSLGPRFGTRLPVKGREWGTRVEWKVGHGRRIEVSVRNRNRLENEALPDEFNRKYDFRIWIERFSAKIAFQNTLTDFLRLKLQISYADISKANDRFVGWGSLALLNLNFNHVKLFVQTSMFASDDHESRAYFYEYDMLGSFRIPSFSGYGHRSYLMGQFEVIKRLIIRIKFGVTEYFDRQVIGTGADASVGARRWNGEAQLRLTF